MDINPLGDDPFSKFFGMIFGAILLISALSVAGNVGAAELPSFPLSINMGENLISLPSFFQGTGKELDGVYSKYPITQAGRSNCVEEDYNPDCLEWGFDLINEIVGQPVYVSPGQHVSFSAYVYAETQTSADTHPYRGVVVIMDMYGSEGRICEIATPDGHNYYYPSNSTTNTRDGTYTQRGTNSWVQITYDFTVKAQYEADGYTVPPNYDPGEMAVPLYFLLCMVSICGHDYLASETGKVWLAEPELYVYA